MQPCLRQQCTFCLSIASASFYHLHIVTFGWAGGAARTWLAGAAVCAVDWRSGSTVCCPSAALERPHRIAHLLQGCGEGKEAAQFHSVHDNTGHSQVPVAHRAPSCRQRQQRLHTGHAVATCRNLAAMASPSVHQRCMQLRLGSRLRVGTPALPVPAG